MDSFQQPAFCFSLPTEDFDPNHEPTDGEQYLQSVIYERKKCPAIVVRPLKKGAQEEKTKTDESQVSPSIWVQYAAEAELEDCTPNVLLPTAEWIQIQSNAFQQLHDRITQIRQHFQPNYENVDLPENNSEEFWLEYCQNKEPLLENVLHVHQRDLEQVIEYQSNWLVDDIDWYLTNKHWFGQWVYSLLACLRLPCEPNLLNSLRKIVKTCIRLRNKLSSDKTIDSATPLNLLICIVSRNFYQSDLSGKSL